MDNDFNHLDNQEKLKVDNEFMKMKLMLEQGASFGNLNGNEKDLSPEIENEFLKHILAFEKQSAERKSIKLFDKIGKPKQFKPVTEIAAENIESAWENLDDYLIKHGISLNVRSPNVTVSELYRFTVEELFEYEMDDMDLPGWMSQFTYDDFYQDPIYENSRIVEESLISDIFTKDRLVCQIDYDMEGFIINGILYHNFAEFSEKINRFKDRFDSMFLEKFLINICIVKEAEALVTGYYNVLSSFIGIDQVFSGICNVKLTRDDLGYWNIKEASIEGVDLD